VRLKGRFLWKTDFRMTGLLHAVLYTSAIHQVVFEQHGNIVAELHDVHTPHSKFCNSLLNCCLAGAVHHLVG
jgi:hypothetical protein